MKLNVMLDDGALMPERAHETDAGWDLKTPKGFTIDPHSNIIVNTGVHFEIPKGYCGEIWSKSGLNVNRDTTSTGLIDSGYTGPIVVKLYNNGEYPVEIGDGCKITQIVFKPIAEVEELNVVDNFKETERGYNGFGSTGE